MKTYSNFKTLVVSITTALLFFLWKEVFNLVQSNWLVIALGFFVSIGTYRSILKIAELAVLKIERIKKLVFGRAYLEGTWVGCYVSTDHNPVYYIENHEQSFDGLVIRGRCYYDDGAFKGTWNSGKVMIDEDQGKIYYTYETDMVNNLHANQGFAIFSFLREKANMAPLTMVGFSSDIYSKKKTKSKERKVIDGTKDEDKLLAMAKDLYNTNKLFFNEGIPETQETPAPPKP